MMTKKPSSRAAALFILLSCAACSTSQEVLQLAETTASNASLVNTHLADFAKNSRAVAHKRTEAIAQLSHAVEMKQAEFDAYLEGASAAAKIAGEDKKPNDAAVIVELRNAADAIRAGEVAAQGQREAVVKDVLSGQAPLELPKDSLTAISKNLGALSKDAGSAQQLSFFIAFFKQVLAEVELARADAEQKAGAAIEGVEASDSAKDLFPAETTGS